jgi:hypothetical protein
MLGTADLSQIPGRVTPIYLEGKLLPLTTAQARELKLKDSEVVQALVQARDAADLTLLIRGRSLTLASGVGPAAWLPGQQVMLQVQATAQGWLLQPLAGQPPSNANAAQFFSRIGQLLFRPPGLQVLSQLFKPGVLDALLQNAGRADLQGQWRGMQLSMAQLNPQALGQAMAAAMGSETWLARGLAPPPDDPKQLMRRLLAALSQKDGKESEEVEGEGLLEGLGELRRAIEELESAQVQAVQAHAQRELLFTFVLPFADAEPVEIQFRRPPRQGDEQPPFTVNVHSRNEALGELWLKTQLHGLDRVDLTMWALKDGVVEQARSRSGELAQQLAEAGLTMRSFEVIHGPRPESPSDWKPSGRGMVVDVSA